MSNILKCLKILNFEHLYLQSKLSFFETLRYNQLAFEIFHDLTINTRMRGSKLKSFDPDIETLEDFFKLKIFNLNVKTAELKKDLKLQFNTRDGLTDSINLCLFNINEKNFFFLLLDLTKSFEAE